MVACMVQAFPYKTPAQIKQDLLSISDRYNNPDNDYGYGIPDFSQYNLNKIKTIDQKNILVYPNPASENIFIKSKNDTDYQIFTFDGKVVLSGQSQQNKIDVSTLPSGIYFFKTGNLIQKFEIE